jgi:hypothetical protein
LTGIQKGFKGSFLLLLSGIFMTSGVLNNSTPFGKNLPCCRELLLQLPMLIPMLSFASSASSGLVMPLAATHPGGSRAPLQHEKEKKRVCAIIKLKGGDND